MSIFNKFKQGVSEASNLAKSQLEATRLKSQITKNQNEINELYRIIGKTVFQNNATESFSTEQVEQELLQVKYLLSQNEELATSIHTIFNQKACACGELTNIDAIFCSKCGHSFTVAATSVEAMASDETVLLVKNEAQLPNLEEQNIVTEKVDTLKNCAQCGSKLEDDAQFCGECGTPVTN